MQIKLLRRLFLAMCLWMWVPAQAQVEVLSRNVEFRAASFPGREKEFEEAFEWLKQGDGYFLRGPVYFEQALEFYLKAQNFNPNNADLNYQIGLCYLGMNKGRLNALRYFERALALNSEMGNRFLFDLGKAYQYSLEFEKAIKVYLSYLDKMADKATPDDKQRADKAIRECESGIELVKNPVRVRIENLGANVNSRFPDYAPVLTADENKLLFTSRREGTTGDLVDPLDSMYLEDIYITYKIDGDWAPSKNIGKPINTDEHDGTISITPDGKKLLMYRTTGGGDIFETTYEGIHWTEPRNLKEINSRDYENHAVYSIDGKHLFFISNRKDVNYQGSKDIFIADVDEKGNLSNIRNAGPVVNTPYEEDGIFCHADGKTIYFSSAGHNTMGGFDIFKTTFENGAFTPPVNVGYPINSPEDDVFFIINRDETKAYFASYREEGYGDKDLYVMYFLKDVEMLSSLQFSVNDTTVGQSVQATIIIKDLTTGKIILERETENGETIANVPAGRAYEVTVKSDRFEAYTEVIDLPFEAGSQVVSRKVEMTRDNQLVVKGVVMDRSGFVGVPAEVEFVELGSLEVVKLAKCDKSGNYTISVPPGRDYVIYSRAIGYMQSADTLRLGKDSKGQELRLDLAINKLDRKLMSVLKGRIFDSETGAAIDTAHVVITELGGIPVLSYQKPGKYDAVVFNGAVYTIQVQVEGYLAFSAQVSVPVGTEKHTVKQDIALIRAEKGARAVLNNIFFDFNKSTLRPNSYKTLNTLLQMMKKNPDMVIEVSGHTDNVGSMSFNQKLSESRAQVVREFLIRNGIEGKRVGAYGRSFRQPIASNDTPEGRQLNRRTEIKIVRMK